MTPARGVLPPAATVGLLAWLNLPENTVPDTPELCFPGDSKYSQADSED